MNYISRRYTARRSQSGVAAVEMAIILPVLIILLAVPLFIGRVFWHYTVAQKAAHDTARFLSTMPPIEFRSPVRASSTVAVARAIASAELADLNPGLYPPDVTITCDGINCNGFTVPTSVTVTVQMPMFDPIFNGITYALVGDDGLLLTAAVTMRHVSN